MRKIYYIAADRIFTSEIKRDSYILEMVNRHKFEHSIIDHIKEHETSEALLSKKELNEMLNDCYKMEG